MSAKADDHSPTTIKQQCSGGSSGEGSADNHGFRVLQESVQFQRYQTVYQRDVQFPNNKRVSFDILGSENSHFQSVFVFPFDTHTKTVTVLREYAPGPHALHHSFVAGMYEPAKHATLEDACRAELSEEANLAGGALLPLSTASIAADKYSRNRFHYYLSLDATLDAQPLEPDHDEYIAVEHGLPLTEVRQLIRNGAFNTPSSLLGMLALDQLRQLGFDS